MPVYVTRAHVTIGDAGKRHAAHKFSTHRRAFHISDICKTPYCFRSFLVVFVGLAVVAGGVVMTIIGYKPAILIPWYLPQNLTNRLNYSDPTAVPRILGEPGPLRILVYIGPILMGIGFFSMMMAIVLFCEIKDRYFNNILPKRRRDAANRKKENLYAMIIEEFRKNYFRGIEVPLKKHTERRKSKQRFSISMSGSGSLMSFGRRLSHEFQRRRRRSSRESQTERTATVSRKRSTIRRFLDPDSWLKTSSLPNIRHKDSFVELHNIYNIDTKIGPAIKRESKSCGPHLDIFRISGDTTGVVNPAYRESPPDKRRRPALRKQRRVTSDSNTHVTTVLVHRESNNEDPPFSKSSNNIPADIARSKFVADQQLKVIKDNCKDQVIDIDKDINLFERCNETDVDMVELVEPSVNCDPGRGLSVCTCGQDVFCTLHALGMDSGGSSLSLSWDNVPCVYNDARRNTEPYLPFRDSKTLGAAEDNGHPAGVLASQPGSSPSQVVHREVIKSKSTAFSRGSDSSMDSAKDRKPKKSKGPFKTKIGVFKSDSNLFRGRRYSFFDGQMYFGLSTDSLDLTEEMLKSFEMAETAYI